ncbi:MAG: LLM class F420-dependent oxidoreductase [Deltaproteobacteria bacterium]|jgi:probable F420-dependent oxidoreductase|nr:LLM class F420-dependent oxidoreductase [Deltaproteobacteria bacterium]
MRFSYAESMCDPSFYLPLARAAEAAGYTSFTVPDNIGYAGGSEAAYPHTEDGGSAFLEDKPFVEPFSLIPAMGAVTETLRFTTFVVKLPIRLPYLVAKQAASVAVITNNRFGFGIGLSPWPEDFRVCGQDWDSRGKRMDEMIEIIRGFTQGDYFEFHGEHYDIERIKMAPTPSEPIPILIGGHSEPALRRAARTGDGWMHAGGPAEELDHVLERLAHLRGEYGREKRPFEIHVLSDEAFSLDGVRRLEDRGVTDAVVAFRNFYQKGPDTQTLQEKIDAVRGYADRIIAKL